MLLTRKKKFYKLNFFLNKTKMLMLFLNFQEIPLSEILSIVMETKADPSLPFYFFKILTSGLELFVSDDSGER